MNAYNGVCKYIHVHSIVASSAVKGVTDGWVDTGARGNTCQKAPMNVHCLI